MSLGTTRLTRRRFVGTLAIGAAAALWTACAAPAGSPTASQGQTGGSQAPAGSSKQTITMKIGTATLNDVQHEWANRMKDRLERRTNGQLAVEVYPASQLGSIPRMIEGVQLGTIEAWMGPPDFLVGVEPRCMVPGIPLLFKDTDEALKVFSDQQVREPFLGMTESKGILGVSIVMYGPMGVFNKTPAKTPEDLRGKKYRVFAAPPEIETMNAWGATGVPMALGEVGTALQQGTIDGAQTGITVAYNLKFYDFVKGATETNHSIITSFGGVSKVWFDQLPGDLQTAIIEEARGVEPELWEWQKGEIDKGTQAWNEITNGGVVKLTDQERKAFTDPLVGVRDKVVEQVPEIRETLEMIERKIREIRA